MSELRRGRVSIPAHFLCKGGFKMAGYVPELSQLSRHWRRLLYSRIVNIFEYENLPPEVNEFAFKLWLLRYGKVIFYKIKDKFVVQPFAYTDKLDWYYVPKNGRVVNPWLPIGFQNKEFELANEAIIFNATPDMYNFREHGIVSDLVFKTANQLAENDISYYCIQRNHRLIAIFTAETDLQKAECNRILERMYSGKPDITMGEDLVSHIKVNPIAMNSTRSSITELIEFAQYTLANFYHSFGINSNYNLKREQLNSNEIDVNQEVLRLNIEDMLLNREQGVSKVNELYNLNIRVSLNEEVYKNLLRDIDALSNNTQGNGEGNKSQTETIETSDKESKDIPEDKQNSGKLSDVQETDTGERSNIPKEHEEMGDEDGKEDSVQNETVGENSQLSKKPVDIRVEVKIGDEIETENIEMGGEEDAEKSDSE